MTTTPTWLAACAAEADKGFDPHIKSYHMGWVAAVEACAKRLEAELYPLAVTDYQAQYNAGIKSMADKLRSLK